MKMQDKYQYTVFWWVGHIFIFIIIIIHHDVQDPGPLDLNVTMALAFIKQARSLVLTLTSLHLLVSFTLHAAVLQYNFKWKKVLQYTFKWKTMYRSTWDLVVYGYWAHISELLTPWVSSSWIHNVDPSLLSYYPQPLDIQLSVQWYYGLNSYLCMYKVACI